MTATIWRGAVMAALIATLSGAAWAQQQSVGPNDIQRLQDQVFQAGSEVSRLRNTDSALAARLDADLDELREEVVYLRVKLRKEGTVPRGEYADLRDRIQELRTRARGETGADAPSAPPAAPSAAAPGGLRGGTVDSAAPAGGSEDRRPAQTGQSAPAGQPQASRSVIPVGQELDVRLQSRLSSDTAKVEDRFEATTVTDLYRGNDVLIPAGSVVRGVISSVDRASRTDRKGSLTVAFDQITVNGRSYPMRGTVTQAIESEGIRGEAGRIGAGAGVGAIIGGIIGGVRGALLGVLIGGGGTIAATEGKDVELPAGTILRVRLDTPPDVPARSAR